MKTCLFLLSLSLASVAYGRELSCILRTELGETITGEHLYERDKDLQVKNLSRINLDTLKITSAGGKPSKIVKVEKNIYRSVGPGTPYYFVTNDGGTIVTELSVQDGATYVKVLLCK